MKAGKALEQLLAAIQEYLKDSPDTHITPNARLLNRSGIEREIDVLVQTKVQDLEIGIAMLSSVLRSPMAIATNIHIMRAFNAMRHFIGSHPECCFD